MRDKVYCYLAILCRKVNQIEALAAAVVVVDSLERIDRRLKLGSR
jgi:hypothetical protein